MGRRDEVGDAPRKDPLGLLLLGRVLLSVTGILVVLAWPVAAATILVGVLVADRRLPRQRWWWTWVAVSFTAGIIAAGGIAGWLVGAVRAPVSAAIRVWSHSTAAFVKVGVPGEWLTAAGVWSWPRIGLAQACFAVPVGLLIVSVFDLSRLHGRRLMGQIEGEGYSNIRPPGWLDRRRAARNLTRGAAGELTVLDQPRTPSPTTADGGWR